MILLNPLVVGADGEWEAWDFGTKSPGATRFRSFAELLAEDVDDLRRQSSPQPPTPGQGADDEVTAARDLLLDWASGPTSVDLDRHRITLHFLGCRGEPDDLALLIQAATNPEPRVRAAAIGGLAASDDPAARQAAVTLLMNPDEEGYVIRSVDRRGRNALLTAWNLGRRPEVLAQLASLSDVRAVPGLIEALVDPDLPASARVLLVQHAAWPGDRSVIPALVAAAELPGGSWESIAQALQMLNASDEQAEMLSRLLLYVVAHGPDEAGYLGHALTEAATLGHPRTTDALVQLCWSYPTAAAIRALGWTSGAATIETLSRVVQDPDLRLAALDALERNRDRAAADVLAERAAAGDVLAVRALARRRDSRALPPLLVLLRDSRPDRALQGADGLRDLRDPAAAGALLEAVVPNATVDLQAVATHALVTLRAPEAVEALHRLSRSESADLRRLAEWWRDTQAPEGHR